MRIAHVTNFEEPTISPFLYIFLELVENSVVQGWLCVWLELENNSPIPLIFGLLCAPWSFLRPLSEILRRSSMHLYEVGRAGPTEFLPLRPWHCRKSESVNQQVKK